MASIPKQAMEQVREIFEDRWIRRGGILVSVVIALVLSEILSDGLLTTIVILSVTALLYLEALETVSLRIENHLAYPSIIPTHQDTNKRVKSRIEEVQPEKIHLLDYSTEYARTVLETAADYDIDIYLLLKVPQSAINSEQALEQIKPALRNGLKAYAANNSAEQLHVRLYTQDGAIRGRRIGDQYLILGWYTRVFETDHEESLPSGETLLNRAMEGTHREAQKLWGHKNPMVEFSWEDAEFEELDLKFFREVYTNLWETGITPYELYEYEINTDKSGTVDGVEKFRTHQYLADKAPEDESINTTTFERYLKQISGNQTERTELFE